MMIVKKEISKVLSCGKGKEERRKGREFVKDILKSVIGCGLDYMKLSSTPFIPVAHSTLS